MSGFWQDVAGMATHQYWTCALQRHAQSNVGLLCCRLHCLAASSGLRSSTDTVMVRCRTWQAMEHLLRTDAVLLGRRLITCGAHAAAEELCVRRQMPADFVVEVTSHMHWPCAMQRQARAASISTVLLQLCTASTGADRKLANGIPPVTCDHAGARRQPQGDAERQ